METNEQLKTALVQKAEAEMVQCGAARTRAVEVGAGSLGG